MSDPKGTQQEEFVHLLAEPIPAGATQRLRVRLNRLRALVELLTVPESLALRRRLNSPTDHLGELFRLELSTTVREQLLTALDDASRGDERGTTPTDKGLGPSAPRPEDPHGGSQHGEGTPAPIPSPKERPETVPTHFHNWGELRPGGSEEQQAVTERTGRDFDLFAAMRGAIGLAAGGLAAGLGVVAGIQKLSELQERIPEYVVKEALCLAYTYMVEAQSAPRTPWRNLKTMGRAGEIAGRHMAEWDQSNRFGAVVPVIDVNVHQGNFPVIDLLSHDKPLSVKTRYSISEAHRRPGPNAKPEAVAAWERKVGQAYARDLLMVIGDKDIHPKAVSTRLASAKAILNHLEAFREQGGLLDKLPGTPTIEEVVEFIRSETHVLIPSDHVSLARRAAGELLVRMYEEGKLNVLGIPQDLAPNELLPIIGKLIWRLAPNAVASSDLQAMLGVLARHPNLQTMWDTKPKEWPREWGDPPRCE